MSAKKRGRKLRAQNRKINDSVDELVDSILKVIIGTSGVPAELLKLGAKYPHLRDIALSYERGLLRKGGSGEGNVPGGTIESVTIGGRFFGICADAIDTGGFDCMTGRN